MPIRIGAGNADVGAFEAQIVRPYRMRTEVDILSTSGDFLFEMTGRVTGGSVQVQANAEGATRSLSLEMFDPTDELGLTSATGALVPRYTVRVRRAVYVDALARWVSVPVFRGPITKPVRKDDTLQIEAQDMASIADSFAPSLRVRRGTNAATAIRQIMSEACGERRFRIASTSYRLQSDQILTEGLTPWQLVRRICRAVGWVAFYDGDGYLVCRPRSSAPVFTFRGGTFGTLTGGVERGFWDADVKNQVVVRGGVVSRTQVVGVATLDAGHPLSPEALAIRGVRRFLRETINDSSIRTYGAARDLAVRALRDLSIQQTAVSFESLPVWHLQEHDAFALIDPKTGERVVARVTDMTIPLTAEGMQAMGFLARSARSRRPLRVRPKSAALIRAEAKVRAAKAKARRVARERARKAAARKKAAQARARKKKR